MRNAYNIFNPFIYLCLVTNFKLGWLSSLPIIASLPAGFQKQLVPIPVNCQVGYPSAKVGHTSRIKANKAVYRVMKVFTPDAEWDKSADVTS